MSLFACAVLIATLAATAAAKPAPDCGDVNADNHITVADALEALRAAVALSTCDLCICDVDGTGGVTVADALVLLAIAVGSERPLDCPPCPTTTVFVTTTTTEAPKVACGDPRAGAPNCDGYCGVNGQMCIESPPHSGNCQCIFGPTCGVADGPPECAGGCHSQWICKQVGNTCRCVF